MLLFHIQKIQDVMIGTPEFLLPIFSLHSCELTWGINSKLQ